MGAQPSLRLANNDPLWTEAVVLHEGLIDKKGSKFGGWTTRYFILLESGVLLSCIKAKNQPVQLTSAKLYLVLTSSCKLNSTIWQGDDRSSFQIEDTKTKRMLHFGAASESIRERWMAALKDAILLRGVCAASTAISCANLRIGRQRKHIVVRLPDVVELDGGMAALPMASRVPKLKLDMFVNPTVPPGGQRESLRETMKGVFTAALSAANLANGAGVLVMDEPSMTAISSMCTMHEITEVGVGEVTSLEQSRRAPMPGYDVVYLIMPDHVSSRSPPDARIPRVGRPGEGERKRAATTAQVSSVDRLIADWELPFQHKPLYGGGKVTVLFLKRPSNEVECLARFDETTQLRSSLASTPKFISAGFELKDDRLFNVLARAPMVSPSSHLVGLFAPASEAMNRIIRDEAARLAEVCIALGEFPVIRYNMNSLQSLKLSNNLQMELERALEQNRTWWRHGASHTTGEPLQLLVMSRSEDLASPFLHSYQTEALVRDMMHDEIDGHRVSFTATNKKNEETASTVAVDSSNGVWGALKSERVYDALRDLNGLVELLRATPSGKIDERKGAGARCGDLNLSEFSDGVAKMRTFIRLKKEVIGVQHLIKESLARLRAIGSASAEDADILPLRVALFEQAIVHHGIYVDTEFRCAAKNQKDMRKLLVDLLKDITDVPTRERLLALWAVTPFGDATAGEDAIGTLVDSSRMGRTSAALKYMKHPPGVGQMSTADKAGALKKKEVEITKAFAKQEGAHLLDFTDRFVPTVALRLSEVIRGTSELAIVKSVVAERAGSLPTPSAASSASSLKKMASASSSVRGKGNKSASPFFSRESRSNGDEGGEERLGEMFKDLFEGRGEIETLKAARHRPRYMVYMIGGLTHYEIQKLLELENDRCEILAGADLIVSAKEILRALNSPVMSEGAEGGAP